MKNFLVISLLAVLLFHNVFAFYEGVFFSDGAQFESKCNNSGQSDKLVYTEADCDVINQFIFDSEFKNINASISVFEEHRNLNSEIKYNFSNIPTLTLSDFLSEIKYKSTLLSVQFVISNSFQLALQGNLFSFRT